MSELLRCLEWCSIWKGSVGRARFAHVETCKVLPVSKNLNVGDTALFLYVSNLACKTTLCRKNIGLPDLIEDPGQR